MLKAFHFKFNLTKNQLNTIKILKLGESLTIEDPIHNLKVTFNAPSPVPVSTDKYMGWTIGQWGFVLRECREYGRPAPLLSNFWCAAMVIANGNFPRTEDEEALQLGLKARYRWLEDFKGEPPEPRI